jgi:peptidoglycan-associated lipoprotein
MMSQNGLKIGFQKTIKVAMIAAAALAISACASKKKADDAAGGGGIDSTAMSFAPSGSDSGQIPGLRSVNFDYDRATLTASARQIIKGNVEWMNSNPRVNMQIEGHCDARGSVEYNLSLGERRAKAVQDYMISLGVAANRLSIISYGKEKPLSMGDSEADHARNRRANFVPLGN